MFKMLIVEDEKLAREGLRDFLDWGDLGVEISGIAFDGIDGLEKAKKIKPDIIITDIKMPGIDGLEMAKKIRQFLPAVKIIILTGYSDFEFAKEAISFHAFEYLLKPIEEEELVDVANRVVAECKIDLRKSEEEKEKVLIDLLEGKKERNSLIKSVQDIALNISDDAYRAVVISYDNRADDYQQQLNECQIVDNELADLLANQQIFLKIDKKNSSEYYLFVPEKDLPNILSIIKENKATLAKSSNVEMVVGIGKKVNEIYDIYISCQQARQALNYGLFWGEYELIDYSTVERKKEIFNNKVGLFLQEGDRFKKQINQSIRSANKKLLAKLLNELFDLIEKNQGIEPGFIANYLFNLINETSLVVYNILGSDSNISDIKEDIINKISKLSTLNEMKLFVNKVYMDLFQYIYQRTNNKDEYIVKKVIAIIESNYMKGLTLRTIADQVFISPNYLGKIFKKSTGISFNKYLKNLRMEKAKELLQSSENAVGAVAEKVGINNSSYFCVLFKKTYGTTPGEYQELYMRK